MSINSFCSRYALGSRCVAVIVGKRNNRQPKRLCFDGFWNLRRFRAAKCEASWASSGVVPPPGSEKGLDVAPALRHIYALAAVVPNSHTTPWMGHKRDDVGTLRAKGREGGNPFNLRGSKRRGMRRSLA